MNMLNNKSTGFTIAELLVVISIIAVLTSLVVVNYRSIQARSRSSNASASAELVARKAEAWKSALGTFPTYTQLSTGKINTTDTTLTGPAESRITDASNTLLNAAIANPTNELATAYRSCTTGAQVEWYDEITKSVKFIGVGGASSTAACS